jgi:hypothetical protein
MFGPVLLIVKQAQLFMPAHGIWQAWGDIRKPDSAYSLTAAGRKRLIGKGKK